MSTGPTKAAPGPVLDFTQAGSANHGDPTLSQMPKPLGIKAVGEVGALLFRKWALMLSPLLQAGISLSSF